VTLFKNLKFRNYSFKESNITNYNALNAQIFIKNLLLKIFKEYRISTNNIFQ